LISDDFTLKIFTKSSFICHYWNIKKLAQASPGKGRKSQLSGAKNTIFSLLKVIIVLKFLKIFNKSSFNVYLELYYHFFYWCKYFLVKKSQIFWKFSENFQKNWFLGLKLMKNHNIKYCDNILNPKFVEK